MVYSQCPCFRQSSVSQAVARGLNPDHLRNRNPILWKMFRENRAENPHRPMEKCPLAKG